MEPPKKPEWMRLLPQIQEPEADDAWYEARAIEAIRASPVSVRFRGVFGAGALVGALATLGLASFLDIFFDSPLVRFGLLLVAIGAAAIWSASVFGEE